MYMDLLILYFKENWLKIIILINLKIFIINKNAIYYLFIICIIIICTSLNTNIEKFICLK